MIDSPGAKIRGIWLSAYRSSSGSLATHPVCSPVRSSGNREVAKGGSEAGAERANDLRSVGRPMTQRRELSTDQGRSSSVVCKRGGDRARHVDAAIAAIAQTSRSQAWTAWRAPRRWTHEAGLSNVLLASAPPTAGRPISDYAAGSPVSRAPALTKDWRRSRAGRTKPVMALFVGAR